MLTIMFRHLLLLTLASILPASPLLAEVIFSDSFSYNLPDRAPLTGEAAAGTPGMPWKTVIEQPAARILLGQEGANKFLLLSDSRQKPREEIYAFFDRLSVSHGATIYYGATITPAKANDNPESGRLMSFSTSDKRGEGTTRARLSIWRVDGSMMLGIDSDGTLAEGSRRFPPNEPIRVVVRYSLGGGSQLWAGKPGALVEGDDLIAESPGHRKDPFSCIWIGIPSNAALELDDLVIATTWEEAASAAK